MADWYYAKNGQRFGPISPAQLKQLAQSGELRPDDLVFKEGGKDWIPANTVSGLFGGSVSKGSATASRGDDRGSLDFDDDSTRRSGRRSGGFGDMLLFRRMIAPWVLIFLFWVAVIVNVVGGLGFAVFALIQSKGNLQGILTAVGTVILIPVTIFLLRLYVEVLIVVFRINETLIDIREVLEKQRERG